MNPSIARPREHPRPQPNCSGSWTKWIMALGNKRERLRSLMDGNWINSCELSNLHLLAIQVATASSSFSPMAGAVSENAGPERQEAQDPKVSSYDLTISLEADGVTWTPNSYAVAIRGFLGVTETRESIRVRVGGWKVMTDLVALWEEGDILSLPARWRPPTPWWCSNKVLHRSNRALDYPERYKIGFFFKVILSQVLCYSNRAGLIILCIFDNTRRGECSNFSSFTCSLWHFRQADPPPQTCFLIHVFSCCYTW